ncbi:MAG: MoaD/ThiS family protein [Desulfurococcaceae archaeon TW002]
MKIKFFGILKDFSKMESVDVELKEPVRVKELLNFLANKLSWFNDFLTKIKEANISIIVLVNDSIVSEEYLLREGDIVTLLPPAAGG